MFKHKLWEKVKKHFKFQTTGEYWEINRFKKKKKNGIYKARLLALGYHQIPGIDHGDSLAQVINKITFRIILILITNENLTAQIVDIEIVFL